MGSEKIRSPYLSQLDPSEMHVATRIHLNYSHYGTRPLCLSIFLALLHFPAAHLLSSQWLPHSSPAHPGCRSPRTRLSRVHPLDDTSSSSERSTLRGQFNSPMTPTPGSSAIQLDRVSRHYTLGA